LSGRKPFEGGAFLEVIHNILSTEPRSLGDLRPDLPPKLVALVHQAIRKEVIERVPSVVALAEGLAPFASVPQQASASGLAETAPSAPTQATPVAVQGSRPPARATTAPRATLTPDLPRSRRGLTIAVIAVIAAAAALTGFFSTRRPAALASGRVAQGPASLSLPSQAPIPAVVVAPRPAPALVAPSSNGPAGPPAAPTAASVPVPAPGAAPSGPNKHRPNKRDVRFVGGEEPPVAAQPPSPPQPQRPAPAAETPRTGHPIEIEKDNPYGN
jgi:hypothetical protein